MTLKKSWQAIVADARSYRDRSIVDPLIQPPVPTPPEKVPRNLTKLPHAILTPEEIRLTELLPEQLVAELAANKVSAVTVAQAFLCRAGLAQRLANCVVELLPQRALEQAKALDEHMAKHRKPVGPLHGLPVSIKEHISQEGVKLSLGYVALWDSETVRPKGSDALAVKYLHAAGAIIYVRTTEPQTIMHLETSSNLWGVTPNPHNTHLSAGGSSGGEGALMALRGSCLGVGSDIGGSIRSPAGNCGVFGLRPTAHRIPYLGVEASAVGSGGIDPVQGPLSTSVEGIRMYMRLMAAGQPWLKEPPVVPLPWKELPKIDPSRRPLKLGVIWHDGVVKPHPPIMRGMRETVEKLRAIPGVSIHDLTGKHPSAKEAWDIISSLYFADGGEGELNIMASSGEPLRPLTRWLLKEDGHVRRLSIEELWKLQRRREKFVAQWNETWLNTDSSSSNSTGSTSDTNNDNEIDALLLPYFPSASSRLDTAKYWAYTATFNLIDQPALVFPVTKADPELDPADANFEPFGDQDRWNHELYDAEVFSGAPVSLQLVTRRFQEEKLLNVAEFIAEKVGAKAL